MKLKVKLSRGTVIRRFILCIIAYASKNACIPEDGGFVSIKYKRKIIDDWARNKRKCLSPKAVNNNV